MLTLTEVGPLSGTTTPEETEADQRLMLASTFRRTIQASTERIWENVFDWEHLPALHDTYFNQVEKLAVGDWGWRLRLSRQPGTPDRAQVLELLVDRPRHRYTVLTLEGVGAGTRFWTCMTPRQPHVTDVEVQYFLPAMDQQRLDMLGQKYLASCERLWSEDEGMMQHRERMLALAGLPRPPSDPVALGPVATLRRNLPMTVLQGGRPFRIIELDGELVAHSTICPHWLGPLDDAPVQDGQVRCPWHGWLFDVRSGASADGHGWRLARAPSVEVDASGQATLVPPRRRDRDDT